MRQRIPNTEQNQVSGMKAETSPQQITVFYDGTCPLCRREISVYKRCKGAEQIRWNDISQIDKKDVAPGLSKSEAMARFHVIDTTGQLRSGAAAFLVVWRSLPSFRVLGHLQRVNGAVSVLEWVYLGFLKLRPMMQSVLSRLDRN